MQYEPNTVLVNLNRYTANQTVDQENSLPSPSLDIKPQDNLQHLNLEYNGSDFDPQVLLSFDLPQNLVSLAINVRGAIAPGKVNSIVRLGSKLRNLTSLKSLSIRLPTTSHTNLMIHHMPDTLINIEDLDLEFIEPEASNDCEEFYVNSCLEWTAVMKKLQRFRLRSTRINYTYCSFMKVEDLLLDNLNRLEWTDDTLLKGFNDKMEVRGDSWIECKKEEDLLIVFGFLIPERIEHLEMPLVFDGLSGSFALSNFLSLFERLSVLKELRLSIGFKLLEEANITALEEALKTFKTKMNLERLSLTVYYRELGENIPAMTFSLENRQRMLNDSGIAYIHYPKLR